MNQSTKEQRGSGRAAGGAVVLAAPVRPKGRRATITDVAKAASVARATVSAVLNNRPHCYASKATRERVQRAAAALGYRPTPLAQALMGKRTATMGLIAPSFETEPTAAKFTGFEGAARERGIVSFMVGTRNDPHAEDQAIRSMLDRYVDGLAIYPTEHGPHTELRRLVEMNFPVVTFDAGGRLGFDHDDVSADIVAEGRAQAEHLISIGRRRLCLLTGVERCFVNDLKTRGFMEGAAAAGVTATHLSVPLPDYSEHKWQTAEFNQFRDVLEANRGRFDAIATQGDLLGMAVIRVAVELGLRVPEDLAVVAINGTAAGGEGAVPISSVWHDSAQIGKTAFQMICDRLDGRSQPGEYRQIKMPVKLIARASTVGWKTPGAALPRLAAPPA